MAYQKRIKVPELKKPEEARELRAKMMYLMADMGYSMEAIATIFNFTKSAVSQQLQKFRDEHKL